MRGDERRLKQVLYNLVSNAIRFTPTGGEIEITVCRQGDSFALSVSDTGIGIKQEEQEEVFERFKKGSNAGHLKSAGLGLSLVRSFIQLHGGEVHLESTIDEGTTVTCLIPAQMEVGEAVEA
jgi:signal transduction histidine kinase